MISVTEGTDRVFTRSTNPMSELNEVAQLPLARRRPRSQPKIKTRSGTTKKVVRKVKKTGPVKKLCNMRRECGINLSDHGLRPAKRNAYTQIVTPFYPICVQEGFIDAFPPRKSKICDDCYGAVYRWLRDFNDVDSQRGVKVTSKLSRPGRREISITEGTFHQRNNKLPAFYRNINYQPVVYEFECVKGVSKSPFIIEEEETLYFLEENGLYSVVLSDDGKCVSLDSALSFLDCEDGILNHGLSAALFWENAKSSVSGVNFVIGFLNHQLETPDFYNGFWDLQSLELKDDSIVLMPICVPDHFMVLLWRDKKCYVLDSLTSKSEFYLITDLRGVSVEIIFKTFLAQNKQLGENWKLVYNQISTPSQIGADCGLFAIEFCRQIRKNPDLSKISNVNLKTKSQAMNYRWEMIFMLLKTTEVGHHLINYISC